MGSGVVHLATAIIGWRPGTIICRKGGRRRGWKKKHLIENREVFGGEEMPEQTIKNGMPSQGRNSRDLGKTEEKFDTITTAVERSLVHTPREKVFGRDGNNRGKRKNSSDCIYRELTRRGDSHNSYTQRKVLEGHPPHSTLLPNRIRGTFGGSFQTGPSPSGHPSKGQEEIATGGTLMCLETERSCTLGHGLVVKINNTGP